jgi:hypothetical protein
MFLSSVWNSVPKQFQFLQLSKSSNILFTLDVTLRQLHAGTEEQHSDGYIVLQGLE